MKQLHEMSHDELLDLLEAIVKELRSKAEATREVDGGGGGSNPPTPPPPPPGN